MIVKNKQTRKTLNLTQEEFFAKFYHEIKIAFESYKRTYIAKNQFKVRYKRINLCEIENDFKNDIKWNFNNLANSNWYIKKI